LENILINSAIVFQTIIGGWALFKWKSVRGAQRVLIVLLIEIPCSSWLETFASLGGKNNLWVIHVSTLCEFLLVVSMFILWKERRGEKRALLYLCCLFAMVWVIGKLTFEPMIRFDSYTGAAARVIETIIAIAALVDVLNGRLPDIRKDPRFWVSSAIIIYSTGSLMMVVLFNEMMSISSELVKKVWPFNWLLFAASLVLMARGLMCRVDRRDVVSG
jgi:hypothetical protein